jgi:hypothetical protein
VKEQSHKDEMSAALRGDFERLRERGVTTTLSPGEAETVESELDVVEAKVEVEIEPEPAPQRPPGWLGRLLGR